MAVVNVGQPVSSLDSASGTSGTFTAFSPNANSTYVVCVVGDTDNSGTSGSVTVSWGSGGSGTWAQASFNQTNGFSPARAFWWVTCSTAPGSSTISVSTTHVTGFNATVTELTGCAASPVGATANDTTVSHITISLTPNRTGSIVFAALTDRNENLGTTMNGSTTLLAAWSGNSTNGETLVTEVSSGNTTAGVAVSLGFSSGTGTGCEQSAVEFMPPLSAGANAVQAAQPFPPFSAPFIEPNVVPFQLQGDDAAPFLTLTDTGSGSDAITVAAAVPLADTAAGDDSSFTVTAAVPLTDTATGDDTSLTVTAAVPLTDTGTAADSISVNTGTDPNQALPQVAWMFMQPNGASFQLLGDASGIPQISLTDAGTAADTVTVAAAVPLTDAAAGDDSSFTVTAAVPLTDTGTAADAATVAAAVPLTDTATAADSITVLIAQVPDSAPLGRMFIPFGPPFYSLTADIPFQLLGDATGPPAIPVFPPFTVTASDQPAATVTTSSGSTATITASDGPIATITSTSG